MADLTTEKPSVVKGNFALSFSLKFLSIFKHKFFISSPIDPITLIDICNNLNFSKIMPTLVKADDIRSGTKDNALHCWLQLALGINGLINYLTD